jgi:hydroxymethylglutaryl-CoA reductase (NADPH)
VLPPLPRIERSPEDDYSPAAVTARLEQCQRAAGRELPFLAGRSVPLEEARGKIENLVGFAQVPVGIAGPLGLDTHQGFRSVYVPLATTEGAMVASYSRGMRLLSAAGTARARVLREGLSQHPMLVYPDARRAAEAAQEVPRLLGEMEGLTASITRHGRLEGARPELVGRRLVLCLEFTSGEAIGINMAAHAADLCSALLERRTGAERRYVHGEDVEKRANARALIEGRGRSTVCDATIPAALLAEHLRVTPDDMVAIQRSYQIGFARLGTGNHLIQSANGLAAALIACGQDVAYLSECATGFLDLERTGSGDLYACAFLPSLLLGTVGGGSGQGTAAESLDILGVRCPGGANLLAEILAATVLAGDLSLLASFCTHEFVAAHEALGRNRPTSEQR